MMHRHIMVIPSFQCNREPKLAWITPNGRLVGQFLICHWRNFQSFICHQYVNETWTCLSLTVAKRLCKIAMAGKEFWTWGNQVKGRGMQNLEISVMLFSFIGKIWKTLATFSQTKRRVCKDLLGSWGRDKLPHWRHKGRQYSQVH